MIPVLQAMLLADHLYSDRDTGKKIIVGVFHRLLFTSNPLPLKTVERDGKEQQVIPGGLHSGSPYLYISLVDVRGTQPFTLRYVDLENYNPVFQTDFEIDCKDPLETVEVVLPLPKLPTVKAGKFVFELICRDEPVGSYRISVEEFNIEGQDNDH